MAGGVEDARAFSEGVAAASCGDRWGLIDRMGAFAVAPKYRWALDFSEGLASVMDDTGRYGSIAREGKVVIAPQFYLGGADFSTCCLWGHIDRSGRYVWPLARP